MTEKHLGPGVLAHTFKSHHSGEVSAPVSLKAAWATQHSPHLKKNKQDWEDVGSVNKAPAGQMWGPEFRSPAPMCSQLSVIPVSGGHHPFWLVKATHTCNLMHKHTQNYHTQLKNIF